MARSDDDPNYKVGYGKPPKASQFKKDQSGNPRGRPPGAKNKSALNSLDPFSDMVLAEAERPISFMEAGVRQELPTYQVLIRKLNVEALAGDYRKAKLLTELVALAQRTNIDEREKTMKVVTWYRECVKPKFDAARNSGKPDPVDLPHPNHVGICKKPDACS